MPSYHRLGEVPRKRHIAFRQPDGSLYHEHVMGSRGFSGPESILYHLHAPTRVVSTRLVEPIEWGREKEPRLRMRHFHLHELPEEQSAILHRAPLLFNGDVA